MKTHTRPLFTALRLRPLALLAVVALQVTIRSPACAQSALDGFDPNANGTVRVAVVQTDGKVLIGGEFTTLAPNGGPTVTRNYLARLNANGTIDSAFNPNANNFVISLAVQPDGAVLAGGTFTSIGGQTRSSMARLDAATGLADSFDPNANAFVQAIAVQVDGKIVVGGGFTSIGGQPRNFIARLDPVTGFADSFNPNADNAVRAITLQPSDGKILAGGIFTNIGGQARSFLGRLNATTGLADSFNPNANNFVRAIAVQPDGKIVAGGLFSGTNSIGGQTRNFIARLDPTTGAADAFNPNGNAEVRTLALQTDGKILAGGDFSGANSIGGQTRNFIARLDPTTGAADAFDPNANSFVRTLAVQSDGKIIVGGLFTTLAPSGGPPVMRNRVARLAPLQLLSASSRKTHGAAGDFAVNLPLAGEPGVECRSSGGSHTLVFTTNNNLVSGNASVTAGTGAVSGAPTFSGNTMTVNLTGVTDVQKITVNLANVTDSFGQVLPSTGVSVNMLIGDINGSKSVSASDIGAVKAASGAPADATRFRADVVVSGSITASDIGLVKSRSGQNVP